MRGAENEAGKLRDSQGALSENDDLEGTGIIYTATIKNALEVQKYLHDQLGDPGRRLSLETAKARSHRACTNCS